MEELKPCPFCGGEALLQTLSNIYDNYYKICCTGENDSDCAGLGLDNYYETEQDAVAAWNKRVPAWNKIPTLADYEDLGLYNED